MIIIMVRFDTLMLQVVSATSKATCVYAYTSVCMYVCIMHGTFQLTIGYTFCIMWGSVKAALWLCSCILLDSCGNMYGWAQACKESLPSPLYPADPSIPYSELSQFTSGEETPPTIHTAERTTALVTQLNRTQLLAEGLHIARPLVHSKWGIYIFG